ncbi:MFS transporter [Paractinoplanes rhizophilus]|uniref:MFS transporter n=1 Tax=Paractinoplanes rhizophilus TaxID=1416877 RepID=A0ABW2I1L2_9ACTN
MTSLWRNREFNLLWTSQSLSDLGDGVAALALSLLVLAQTGSPVSAGLVGTVALAGRLVFRVPAGVLADRFDRRRVMVVCDLVRLTGFTALTIAVVTDPGGPCTDRVGRAGRRRGRRVVRYGGGRRPAQHRPDHPVADGGGAQ